jgi:hypothetical protein
MKAIGKDAKAASLGDAPMGKRARTPRTVPRSLKGLFFIRRLLGLYSFLHFSISPIFLILHNPFFFFWSSAVFVQRDLAQSVPRN